MIVVVVMVAVAVVEGPSYYAAAYDVAGTLYCVSNNVQVKSDMCNSFISEPVRLLRLQLLSLSDLQQQQQRRRQHYFYFSIVVVGSPTLFPSFSAC